MSSKPQSPPYPPPSRGNATVDLLFEPTGDLEKDYCAYCEIEDKNDRDDIIEGILREELDSQATPISQSQAPMSAHSINTTAPIGGNGSVHHRDDLLRSDSTPQLTQGYNSQYTMASTNAGAAAPSASGVTAAAAAAAAAAPIIRTTINLRNLAYCLNKRDMQPLADAIPHCPSLTSIRMTGCGLTEHSYKQLVEAVYKSGSIHTLAVDMNPDSLFKDPTVSRKSDKNEINVYASEYRGAHLRPLDEKDGAEPAAASGAKRAPPKPSRPTMAAKKNAAQQASLESADRTPIPLPTGWHAALMTGLQVLSLRGNGITDAQLQPLCDLLATNTELMSLSLWGNKITSVGAGMLAKALAQNGKLITLNLGHNQLDDDGVAALMSAFLTRDVAYDEMCRLRTASHALLAANTDKSDKAAATAAGAAAGAAGAAVPAPPPPAEPPLFPGYGDITAAAVAKQIEDGTVATIKAYGIPVSTSTGAAPAVKKKEAPAAGKRKGMGDGPLERSTDPFDRDVVRLYEDPIASPATTNLIAQQLSIAATSTSAATVQTAILQLQQLSKFRVPGNSTLTALNLSFNPSITAKGVASAMAVLATRAPTADQLYATLAKNALRHEFQQTAATPTTANKGAPPTPTTSILGMPIVSAIPTVAGIGALAAPAANASVIATQMQSAIMAAPVLHTLTATVPHHMLDDSCLRQLDMESSRIDSMTLQQLQNVVRERRAFLAERKEGANGSSGADE